MNTEIRFDRLFFLVLLAVIVSGILGFFINLYLRMAGPIFFLLAFVANFAVFFIITKKAQRGEIAWLAKNAKDD